jgi:hypothetical protein
MNSQVANLYAEDQAGQYSFLQSTTVICFVVIAIMLLVFGVYTYTVLANNAPPPQPPPLVIPRPSVRVAAKPQRVVLSANPNAKTPAVTLYWTIRNGQLQSISPSVQVPKEASQVTVFPTQTTTYRITAFNETTRQSGYNDVTVYVDRSAVA